MKSLHPCLEERDGLYQLLDDDGSPPSSDCVSSDPKAASGVDGTRGDSTQGVGAWSPLSLSVAAWTSINPMNMDSPFRVTRYDVAIKILQ